MKALLFMPFAFAAGAEGFALFAPYLVGVMAVLYLARTLREARPLAIPAATFRRRPEPGYSAMPDLQPAM